MKLKFILFLSAFSAYTYGIEYRKAIQKDVPELLNLINTQAIQDKDKIVILPEKFREGALKKAIEAGRIFVACEPLAKDEEKSSANGSSTQTNAPRIIAYKKLFILDGKEKEEVLQQELCMDQQPVAAGYITNNKRFSVRSIQKLVMPKNLFDFCIYNGADFTSIAHRKKGINNELTNFAFACVMEDAQKAIKEKQLSHIAVVYGITKANAGEKPGHKADRSLSISESTQTFAQKLNQSLESQNLLHFRFKAQMPTFDPKSQECIPQKEGVKGFGCVLAINLTPKEQVRA